LEESLASEEAPRSSLSLVQVFTVFFKAGLAFGGGLSVLALLEEQLVTIRRIVGRGELVTLWSIGRIMPCGTMTAVAVAVGHRLAGFRGTVVALVAMIVPGFVSTVGLAALYGEIAHGKVLDYVDATLLPAALGLIVVSSIRLGREIFRPSLEAAIAVATCAVLGVFDVNPAIVLISGGVIGALFLRTPGDPE